MKVIKFGGTSMGSSEGIKSILNIIKEITQKDEVLPIVVGSAFSDVTNQLTTIADKASCGLEYHQELNEIENRHLKVVREFIEVQKQNSVLTQVKILFNQLEDLLTGISNLRELSLQSKDLILSYGEQLSVFLLSKIAEEIFPESLYINASEWIKTDSNFGNARVNFEETNQNIQRCYKENMGKLLFFTGFIGSNANKRTTTLGRGGSDYTAAIIGSALNASEIQIWTDVDGMLTADPRIVKKAFSLHQVSYVEAMELAYFGAKVFIRLP